MGSRQPSQVGCMCPLWCAILPLMYSLPRGCSLVKRLLHCAEASSSAARRMCAFRALRACLLTPEPRASAHFSLPSSTLPCANDHQCISPPPAQSHFDTALLHRVVKTALRFVGAAVRDATYCLLERACGYSLHVVSSSIRIESVMTCCSNCYLSRSHDALRFLET